MKYLVIAALALAACEEEAPDTAEVVAVKAQCKALLTHVALITPQREGRDPDQVVAALPIEDIQACVASEPEVRACMIVAPDVNGVKKCIPTDDVLGCMQTSAKAKKQAHDKANGAPVDEHPFNDIRSKCWFGDAKAADNLKLD